MAIKHYRMMRYGSYKIKTWGEHGYYFEKNISKKAARRKARKEIENELLTNDRTEYVAI